MDFVRARNWFGIDLSRYNASADLSITDFDLIAAHEPEVSFRLFAQGNRGL